MLRLLLTLTLLTITAANAELNESVLGKRSILAVYWTNGEIFYLECSGYVINTLEIPVTVQPVLQVETDPYIRHLATYEGDIYYDATLDSVLEYLEPHQQAVFWATSTDTVPMQWADHIRTYMQFKVSETP